MCPVAAVVAVLAQRGELTTTELMKPGSMCACDAAGCSEDVPRLKDVSGAALADAASIRFTGQAYGYRYGRRSGFFPPPQTGNSETLAAASLRRPFIGSDTVRASSEYPIPVGGLCIRVYTGRTCAHMYSRLFTFPVLSVHRRYRFDQNPSYSIHIRS